MTNLACTRGGRELFSALNLSVTAGGAVLITGPNGAGKSSLLRIVAGLLRPAAGTLELTGTVALADSRHALDHDQPLRAALAFWTQDGRGERPEHALVAMGIAHLAQVPVRMLSSGQRQRANLARAVAAGADIWLLDEPSNALDTDGVIRLEQAIAAHRARGGIVLIASHLPLALGDPQHIGLGG